MKCDAMGYTHCGREISLHDIGNTFGVHINNGDKPHVWATQFQCNTCKKKDDDIRTGCGDQSDWPKRRREAGLSLGQAARLMNLGTAVYSGLERCRMIAPQAVRDEFERMVGGI